MTHKIQHPEQLHKRENQQKKKVNSNFIQIGRQIKGEKCPKDKNRQQQPNEQGFVPQLIHTHPEKDIARRKQQRQMFHPIGTQQNKTHRQDASHQQDIQLLTRETITKLGIPAIVKNEQH
jgi:hypothetical protein